MDSDQIKELLSSKGIKPSLHRMRILQYLLLHKNHPTADMIYQGISSEIPTLSKTTIYNTLHTFLETGIVQTVNIEDNEIRFDADILPHAHFKCLECNEVYDLHIGRDQLLKGTIEGHRIAECQIYLKGTCLHCLKK